jgi:hypothetical protein
MKNNWVLFPLLILIISCQKQKNASIIKKTETKDYAVFSGVIKNSLENYFLLVGKGLNRPIYLDKNGSFIDTIKIASITTNGLKINKFQIPIYLKNGYNLHLTADAKNMAKSMVYNGTGGNENTYLLAQYKYGIKQGSITGKEIYALPDKEFKHAIKTYKIGLDSIDNSFVNIDNDLLEFTKKQNIKSLDFIQVLYETTKDKFKKQQEVLKKLVKGTPSPIFSNYENLQGKLVSLNDFKGKYLFIDIWGTWIKEYTENIKEINNFKKKYSNKNIHFLTLCADNKASSGTIRFAKEKWRTSIEKNEIIGNHLFIGNDRTFLKEYQVLSLPRYILIDTKGKIINADAPSPNSKKLTEIFKTLNLK